MIRSRQSKKYRQFQYNSFETKMFSLYLLLNQGFCEIITKPFYFISAIYDYNICAQVNPPHIEKVSWNCIPVSQREVHPNFDFSRNIIIINPFGKITKFIKSTLCRMRGSNNTNTFPYELKDTSQLVIHKSPFIRNFVHCSSAPYTHQYNRVALK